ncbi:MAG: AAA family ATPase [Proteobacteria bacterium]|nr:AAA family ATPase [Pseudomonadota bacterium]
MPFGINYIRVQNYRCWADVTLGHIGDQVWFVGPNGAGKTSLLDAIAFPCDLLRLGGLPALSGDLRIGPEKQRISFKDLLFDKEKEAHWEFSFSTDTAEGNYKYELTLLASGMGFEVVTENLSVCRGGNDFSLLERDASGARWRSGELNAETWMPVSPTRGELLLSRGGDRLQTPELVLPLMFLKGVWLLRPIPLLMHGGARTWDGQQHPDRYGRDLDALVDWAIGAFPKHMAGFAEVLGRLTGLTELRAVPRHGRRELDFSESTDAWLPFFLASDGQALLTYVALLATFLPETANVILLDEPGVALSTAGHNELAPWLVELCNSAQLIAVTHSPRTIDEAANSRGEVVVVERRPGQAATATRLEDVVGIENVPGIFGPGEAADGFWRGHFVDFEDDDDEE